MEQKAALRSRSITTTGRIPCASLQIWSVRQLRYARSLLGAKVTWWQCASSLPQLRAATGQWTMVVMDYTGHAFLMPAMLQRCEAVKYPLPVMEPLQLKLSNITLLPFPG